MVVPENYRLAGLLLYQGFLLGPVMGVGIFLFPRFSTSGHDHALSIRGVVMGRSRRDVGVVARAALFQEG